MVEKAREGHWFGKKLQEIGEYSQDRAEYAVWNRVDNSLEYGRKKHHLYLCSALCFSKTTIKANKSQVSG